MLPTTAVPLACFLSMIRPPGVQFENSFLQILPIDKVKCPFVKSHHDIGFHLYTRYNPTVYEELIIGDDEKLAASQIDFHKPTVIYFHAFLESAEGGSAIMVREAYILRGDTNVIVVDAQKLEAGPWYITAAENTWYIGQFAAIFIDYLVSRGLDLSRTHLVGHSLGAQSAGVAGSAIRSGTVSRITGLDPALPLFDKLPRAQKLDAGDAHFVDVIHTDAGIFGVNNPIGHADFYPNGGISPQPGCELEVLWPNQLLLQKCKTHVETKPLEGHTIIFELKQNPKLNIKRKKQLTKQKQEKAITKRNQSKQKPLNVQNTNFKQDTNYERNSQMSKKRQNSNMEFKEHTFENSSNEPKAELSKKRQKRFINLFRRQPDDTENDKFLFRMLDFLVKNRKTVIPVVSVIREMNTLVKSANGELNHVSKERNNYIGTPAPNTAPITFNLELGKDPPGKALLKRILGLSTQTDKLSIGGGGTSSGGLFGR